MACCDEFPRSIVIYNWAAVAGLTALGVAVASQFGVALLVGYAPLLLVAAVGTTATVCSHCRQGASGACPLGKTMSREGER
jgi:hypothetical protein